MHICAKGYPNRILNGREKREQTNRHTRKHFRIDISRDIVLSVWMLNENQGEFFFSLIRVDWIAFAMVSHSGREKVRPNSVHSVT